LDLFVLQAAKRELFEIVLTLRTASRFARGLDGRERQGHQQADDRNHDNSSTSVNARRAGIDSILARSSGQVRTTRRTNSFVRSLRLKIRLSTDSGAAMADCHEQADKPQAAEEACRRLGHCRRLEVGRRPATQGNAAVGRRSQNTGTYKPGIY
jgi:hypothetical protein